MKFEFGIIDHLDRQALPIAETYRDRLDLVRRYDEAGFYGFHLTEHHYTPLGLAPSPMLFLSAASQCTRSIKLIPLVLVLPLYNPLRLASEIVMLDHLSNGRVEFATGKGISPWELAYFGINHLEAPHIHAEGLKVVMSALTEDVVNFRGDHYRYNDVPIEMKPLQRPHPPMWAATSSLDGADRAAKARRNLAFLAPARACKALTDQYRKSWAEEHGSTRLGKLGLARHVYVAKTDAEAQERARFGFAGWYEKFGYLWAKNDVRRVADDGAGRYDAMMIAGTPDRVADIVAEQMETSGCNYFVARFAYGDLGHDESVRALDLFADKVMPQFQAVTETV